MWMLIFNNMWFLEVLLMISVALMCLGSISLYCHHTCINNGRHNPACMTASRLKVARRKLLFTTIQKPAHTNSSMN